MLERHAAHFPTLARSTRALMRALARLPKLYTYSHSRASDTRVCVRAAATPAQVSKMNLDGVGGRLGGVEQDKR